MARTVHCFTVMLGFPPCADTAGAASMSEADALADRRMSVVDGRDAGTGLLATTTHSQQDMRVDPAVSTSVSNSDYRNRRHLTDPSAQSARDLFAAFDAATAADQ